MGKSSKRTIAGQQSGKELQIPASKLPPFLSVAIIVVVSFGVYFNTLFNGFVYDDNGQILQNPWIRDIKHLPSIFYRSVWSFQASPTMSNYYRPLMHVIYMFNYSLFGLKPWGFHLVNVLFHAANSVLVFLVASRLFADKLTSQQAFKPESLQAGKPASALTSLLSVPFVVALLFAVHPIHTEAVAWVGAITDLSFTFFYLLSFYFYLGSGTYSSKNASLLSVSSFFLALLCKEPAATLPLVIIAYDYALRKPDEPFAVRLKRIIPYFVILGIYFFARFTAIKGFAPVRAHGDLSTYQYIINFFPLFVKYLEKLLFPINLNAFYVLHPIASILEIKGIISLVITTAYVALIVIAYRKNRIAFFSLLLIAVPLFPVFYIPALGEAVLAERYLYLPSVGFVILLVMSLVWLQKKMPQYGLAIILITVSVAVLYSSQTIARNPIWKDDLTLFADTVKKSPDGELPNGMLGIALMGAGRFDEAVEQFRNTLKLNPDSANARYNLGLTLMKKGLERDAIPEFQKALALTPNDIDAHRHLANSYARLGMTDEAIEQYRSIIKLNPNSPETYLDFGVALRRKGLVKEAIANYEKALAINPDYAEAHFNLGNVFADSGEMEKAIEHYKSAVRLQPGNDFYHNMLGITYGQKRMYNEAVEQFKEAVRLAPSEPAYRRNLEKAQGLKNAADKLN